MELPVSSKSLKKWERITIKPGITLRKSPFLKERFQADEAYVFEATLRGRKSPEAFVLIRRHGEKWRVNVRNSDERVDVDSRLKAEFVGLTFMETLDLEKLARQKREQKNKNP